MASRLWEGIRAAYPQAYRVGMKEEVGRTAWGERPWQGVRRRRGGAHDQHQPHVRDPLECQARRRSTEGVLRRRQRRWSRRAE